MIYQQHKPNTLKAQVISGSAGRIGKCEASERKMDLNVDRKR